MRCYQFVKDKNFESNSQHVILCAASNCRCYQFVKDKNFESNSQLYCFHIYIIYTVIIVSKLYNSEVIHNIIIIFVP